MKKSGASRFETTDGADNGYKYFESRFFAVSLSVPYRSLRSEAYAENASHNAGCDILNVTHGSLSLNTSTDFSVTAICVYSNGASGRAQKR